jgi:hypothetical protein
LGFVARLNTNHELYGIYGEQVQEPYNIMAYFIPCTLQTIEQFKCVSIVVQVELPLVGKPGKEVGP